MKVKPDISTLLKTGHFYFALTKIPKNLTSLIVCIINKFPEIAAFLHHSGNYKVYFQLTFKLGVLV